MFNSIFGGFFYEIISFLEIMEEFRLSMSAYYVGMEYNYLGLAIFYMAVSLLIYVTLYVFMGIGLYKLSVRRGATHPILSFVPFVRYYQMGKLVGEVRLFGKLMKNLGLLVSIFSAVAFVTVNAYDAYLYARPCIEILQANTYEALAGYSLSVNDLLVTLFLPVNYLSRIAFVVTFAFLVIAFFRYYEKRRPILYSLLGLLLGITGIFVFIVRNHDKYDYMADMRRFYAGGPASGNGYGGNGGGFYGGSGYTGGTQSQSDRYDRKSDGSGGDVFEEYSDDKKSQPSGGSISEHKTSGSGGFTDDSGDDLF